MSRVFILTEWELENAVLKNKTKQKNQQQTIKQTNLENFKLLPVFIAFIAYTKLYSAVSFQLLTIPHPNTPPDQPPTHPNIQHPN